MREFPGGKEWLDWLERRVGTGAWCVAQRLTPRMRDKGYALAISPKRFRELETEYLSLKVSP
jgi:hypothetical protein